MAYRRTRSTLFLETISITDEPCPAPHPNQGTGQLQQSQEIDGFLLRADQEATTFGQPRQRPFHHPPPGGIRLLTGAIELFLTDAPDIRGVVICRHRLMAGWIIIAFAHTKMLRPLSRRLGALHHAGLQGGGQQLGVVDIGRRDGGAQRPSRRFHHEAPFHPFFPRSVGLRPTKSLPIRALPMAASVACHCQSTPPNSAHAWTNTAQRRTRRPRWHHCWKCRCTVLSSPNCWG